MAERIGIVGGGQLGRMLTTPAKELGFAVTVLDPSPNCPAAQVGADQIIGDIKDPSSVAQLASTSDYLTIEVEHVDTTALACAIFAGKVVNPHPETIGMLNDKFVQKKALERAGIPVVPFYSVENAQDLSDISHEFGYPFVLKTRSGGFDGRGNFILENGSDLLDFVGYMNQSSGLFYAEKFIPFEKELSVVAARGDSGETASFPLVETIQKDNICHMVLAPAPVDPRIKEEAQEIAMETMKILRGNGVFGIEMFLTKDGRVVINEVAPRVHNSGHVTMDSCVTSQFEQHIRAITGMPLGDTAMRTSAAVMINILGREENGTHLSGIADVLALPDTHIHLYGKAAKPQRKIGHINVLGDNLDEVYNRAIMARSLIKT